MTFITISLTEKSKENFWSKPKCFLTVAFSSLQWRHTQCKHLLLPWVPGAKSKSQFWLSSLVCEVAWTPPATVLTMGESHAAFSSVCTSYGKVKLHTALVQRFLISKCQLGLNCWRWYWAKSVLVLRAYARSRNSIARSDKFGSAGVSAPGNETSIYDIHTCSFSSSLHEQHFLCKLHLSNPGT